MDEECKMIINQESLEANMTANATAPSLNKLKSQPDEKKVHANSNLILTDQNRRDSFLERNSKVAEIRNTIKNSPINVKKPLHVKIEDKFLLNSVENQKQSKIAHTNIPRQASNGNF